MEILNSKFGNSIYSEFEVKFGVLPRFNFGQALYHFKVWEVRSPKL